MGQGCSYLGLGTDTNFTFFGDTFSHEDSRTYGRPGKRRRNRCRSAVVPVAVGNGSDDFQICDGEVEPGGQPHYTYKIGGPGSLAIVQPYWSVNNNAFIVDDGNSEQFDLAPDFGLLDQVTMTPSTTPTI